MEHIPPSVYPVLQPNEAGLYVHIPFCDHKCIYCDFYSIITEDSLPRFFRLLKKEIAGYSRLYKSNKSFSTIYFGGGTPSFVEPELIESIIHVLREHFTVLPDAEVTLETNPGTVTKEKISRFIAAGINRFSVGVQSFHPDDLTFLTRIHSPETAIRTINDIAECGVENCSLDLIFNLPGQTKEKWLDNLSVAFSLPVQHISAYSLILEKGTILNKLVLDGKVTMQDEWFDAELYELTIEKMHQAGFMMYEVSNFARPGFASRHNSLYWRYHEYLSFGPSAHSFIDNTRHWNISGLTLYLNKLEKEGHAVAGSEIIDSAAATEEYTMLALRSYGIDISDFSVRFPEYAAKYLAQEKIHTYQQRGLMQYHSGLLQLTPRGYALCDEIIKELG